MAIDTWPYAEREYDQLESLPNKADLLMARRAQGSSLMHDAVGIRLRASRGSKA